MTSARPFLRSTLALGAGLGLLLAALWFVTRPVQAEAPRRAAKVALLLGRATLSSGGTGPRQPLAKDALVFENDVVETLPGTKVELRTDDGSAIRVGPSSKLQLKSAFFGAAGEKKFSGKLFFGKVWTNVTGLVGSESKFEIETDNAVAGVRGTTFRIDAGEDKSVSLQVYDGAVAMTSAALAKKKAEGGGRRQVAGPRRISAGEWEKLVGPMMKLSVSADGTAGDPVAFSTQDEAGDEWAAWNAEMDKKPATP